MRIYVDIDDVLCETAMSLCALAAREFDRHVAYADVRAFNLQEVFGLTNEEMVRFSRLSHEPELLKSFPVIPGAVEGVKALRASGAQVDILTGRPAYAHAATADWLRAIGLGDFAVEYVDKYGRAKPRQAGEPETVPLSELLARHYDVAIDDSPVILEKLSTWTQTKVLVFDRPWNRDFALTSTMTRVKGWSEIRDLVK